METFAETKERRSTSKSEGERVIRSMYTNEAYITNRTNLKPRRRHEKESYLKAAYHGRAVGHATATRNFEFENLLWHKIGISKSINNELEDEIWTYSSINYRPQNLLGNSHKNSVYGFFASILNRSQVSSIELSSKGFRSDRIQISFDHRAHLVGF